MIKIIGIAFVGIICYRLIKDTKSELAPLLIVAISAVLIIILSDKIAEIINIFGILSEKSGLGNAIFSSLLKIVGIGYITEFATSVCNDCECTSIGKKIELAGKITILGMSLPIINGIIDTIGGLL